MRPSMILVKEIYSIAIPSMIAVGLSAVMSFFVNQILLAFSTTATAVFGIWLKLQNFSYMPIYGMNNGLMPIISYNYGAGNKDRVRKSLRLAVTVAVCLMCFLLVIYELIPHVILTLFSASENMMNIGMIALRIFCLTLPLGAASMITSSSFQSLSRSRYTLIINLCRQLVILVPVAWLMSLTGKLSLVWTAVLIAEIVGLIMALILRKRVYKLADL